jgi:C4-dicarboxylate transporter DctM subunit
MSPEFIGIISLALLVIILFSGIWISVAMIVIGFLGFAYIRGIEQAFSIVAQIPFSTIADYSLGPVPLFLFMGAVITQTGMGEDLYHTANKWMGQFRGGLAIATVGASALFAAISGSSLAGVSVMGKIAMPEMGRYNYENRLSTGCIACSGSLAILIPPSLTFIMYGILTEQPIGKLFMAGIFPGILLSLLFVIVIMIITARRPEAGPPGPKTTFKEKIVSLKGTWHAVILFLLVLGGIYMGIFTATEAGAVGAFGAVLITAISRRLTLKKLVYSLFDAAETTAMVMFLIIGAFIFMKFLTISNLAFVFSNAIAQLPVPNIIIFMGIIVLYIILGMFLDIFSSIILTIPVVYPLVLALGFDPIWFGVIIVLVCELGLVSPPVGMNVFILTGVVDVPIGLIFRGVLPFIIAILICIVILTIFPQIVLFIPNTM